MNGIHSQETAVEPETVVFELERFELAGERLEVGGRWTGIRGRRFLRPTLTALVNGAEHRALAVLEHKPWAAQDGDWWEAAFPWEGGADIIELSDAELDVAPDISVRLPSPRVSPPAARRRTGGRSRGASPIRLPAQIAGGRPYVDSVSAPRKSSAPLRRGEHEALLRALAQEKAESARLREELARLAGARTEAASALGRRDAVLGRLEEVSVERDTALRTRDEATAASAALAGERDRLKRERDWAIAAREQELARRHDATRAAVDSRLAELRAEVERERATASRMALAVDERDAARSALQLAERERDAARRERDAARKEPNRLPAERDRARGESAQATRRSEAATGQAVRVAEQRDPAVAEANIARATAEAGSPQRNLPPAPALGARAKPRPRPPALPAPAHPRPLPPAAALPARSHRGALSADEAARDAPPAIGATPRRRTAAPFLSPPQWLARALAVAALILAVMLFAVVLHSGL